METVSSPVSTCLTFFDFSQVFQNWSRMHRGGRGSCTPKFQPEDLTVDEKHWKEKREKEYLAQIHNSPYYEKINNNFIGWPTDPRLNGYSLSDKVLDNDTDRISKIDLHTNRQGQEKLAEFIYDRLG